MFIDPTTIVESRHIRAYAIDGTALRTERTSETHTSHIRARRHEWSHVDVDFIVVVNEDRRGFKLVVTVTLCHPTTPRDSGSPIDPSPTPQALKISEYRRTYLLPDNQFVDASLGMTAYNVMVSTQEATDRVYIIRMMPATPMLNEGIACQRIHIE